MKTINIIGAGLAGLMAAVTAASAGYQCRLFSRQRSERAQSVLAEGGINAVLNTMGEDDEIENHFADTMRGGVDLADPNAVDAMVHAAPGIVTWLHQIGVPFNMQDGHMIQRNFGGQKKKRTAFAKSSTGKMLMAGLIDETRKWEADGTVQRFAHHDFIRILTEETEVGLICRGVRIRDEYSGRLTDYEGPVILASGGLAGVFPGMTTGTTQNSGEVTSTLFSQGVRLGNLEMIQYHPTTFGINGKRCLVTEAARGEGGRLFVMRNGSPWYFMEEKYPVLKNLMPRDVVSREIYFVTRQEDCQDQVYLDLTGLPAETWKKKLPDLREEIRHYLDIDAAKKPVPVEPGIHYFMGGIDVDELHRTSIRGLYAGGECCSQYHGANRLGGNSLLGAIYGGKKAAETVMGEYDSYVAEVSGYAALQPLPADFDDPLTREADPVLILQLREILLAGMGIVREEESMQKALDQVLALKEEAEKDLQGQETGGNLRDRNRIHLAEAMLRSALARRESRGAHYRSDYPEKDEEYRKTAVAEWKDGRACITYRPLPERRSAGR